MIGCFVPLLFPPSCPECPGECPGDGRRQPYMNGNRKQRHFKAISQILRQPDTTGNRCIRRVKANAARFRIDPRRIALGGNSTGGHLAMLAAMRPREPRYAAIPLPEESPRVDASVRAVVMHWPIINPLSRYRSLLLEKGRFRYGIGYWQTEANAAEGNPMLMLERGERVDLPRFVSYYRRAGGDIELVYLEEAS